MVTYATIKKNINIANLIKKIARSNYGLCLCIPEVVQNNQAIERQKVEKVADFQSQQNTLESKVQNARTSCILKIFRK